MLLLWRSILEDALQSCKATRLSQSHGKPGAAQPDLDTWLVQKLVDETGRDRPVRYRRQGQQMGR